MDKQEISDLLELRRLTRELLAHLRAMFEPEEVAGLLRAMADGAEARCRMPDSLTERLSCGRGVNVTNDN